MTKDEAEAKLLKMGSVEVRVKELLAEEHHAALIAAGCRPRLTWVGPDRRARNTMSAVEKFAPELYAEVKAIVAALRPESSDTSGGAEKEGP